MSDLNMMIFILNALLSVAFIVLVVIQWKNIDQIDIARSRLDRDVDRFRCDQREFKILVANFENENKVLNVALKLIPDEIKEKVYEELRAAGVFFK